MCKISGIILKERCVLTRVWSVVWLCTAEEDERIVSTEYIQLLPSVDFCEYRLCTSTFITQWSVCKDIELSKLCHHSLLIALDVCKRRLVSLRLPGIPDHFTDSDRTLYMSSLVPFENVHMVRAVGGLIKFLEKKRVGVELEDPEVCVPVLALQLFSLWVGVPVLVLQLSLCEWACLC